MTNEDNTGLRPMVRYTFKSVTGREVMVRSRLGLRAARGQAMDQLWRGIAPNIPAKEGSGLNLVSVEEVAR